VDWFLQDSGSDGVLEIVWDKRVRTVRDTKKPYATYKKDPNRERVPIISSDIQWNQLGYDYKKGQVLVETPPMFTVPDSPLVDVKFPSIIGGELVMLGGNNGSGKSKLMEAAVFNRKEGLPRRTGGQIAYLPQFWPEKLMAGTLRDFFHSVKEQASPHSKGSSYHPDSPAEKVFVKMAAELQFGGSSRIGDSWLNRPFRQFSGGEQRLLWFLAISSMRDIDMLALDEPTNHMDYFIQEKIAKTIRTFPGAVLLSTHDRNLIAALSRGGGVSQGSTRFPVHMILEKQKGKTTITRSHESPIAYMERKMEAARKEAKQFKI
jgi:ATPase subunit of ABC transporter with duplicated ATPase domains